jgi:hypothetical protein
VKPWELLGEARTPDGTDLRLTRHSSEYVILANGQSLMSSRMHGSEEALATLGCRHARLLDAPSVLIGGLGMGFTLRAVLDLLPARGRVVVAELMPAVVEWNRGPLGPLADHPLKDPRVQLELGDVAATANARLYDNQGVATARAALRPNGVFAVWSAQENRKFEQRLHYCGFAVEVARVRGRLKGGGPRHVIVLGHARPGTEPVAEAPVAGRTPE